MVVNIGKPLNLTTNHSLERTHNSTFEAIFANKVHREKFNYSNHPWQHIPTAVSRSTGKPFITSIQHHIINPMGLSGRFQMRTPYNLYAARGFKGDLDDILLIGSTLANRGISPKTKKRIISPSSVARILAITTRFKNESDPVVRSMNRFKSRDKRTGSSFPNPPFAAYCLGLWHVSGWRRDSEGIPLDGWVSIGGSPDSIIYFDKTGLIVGMLAERKRYHQISAAFAKVVRDMDSKRTKTQDGTLFTSD